MTKRWRTKNHESPGARNMAGCFEDDVATKTPSDENWIGHVERAGAFCDDLRVAIKRVGALRIRGTRRVAMPRQIDSSHATFPPERTVKLPCERPSGRRIAMYKEEGLTGPFAFVQ